MITTASLTPLHEDGTGCTHPGPPRMASPHGPALCAAAVRVTHLRYDGKVIELGVAVSAVQQVGGMLTAALGPMLTEVAGWARTLAGDPAFQAAVAASGVLSAARQAETQLVRHAQPGPPPAAGPAAGPAGSGPQLPGQLPLPL